jgi:hypothetical protein
MRKQKQKAKRESQIRINTHKGINITPSPSVVYRLKRITKSRRTDRKPRTIINHYKHIQNLINKLDISKIKTGSRWFENVAAATTIGAMGFLIYSIIQTNDLVNLQQKTTKGIDSTLIIQTQLLSTMQQTYSFLARYQVMRDSLFYADLKARDSIKNKEIIAQGEELKKYINDNKPYVQISKIDCSMNGDALVANINYENMGKMAISDFKATFEARSVSGTYAWSTLKEEYMLLMPNVTKISPLKIAQPEELYLRIKFIWKWPAFNQLDSVSYYKIINIDRANGSCNCKTVPDNEGILFWK